MPPISLHWLVLNRIKTIFPPTVKLESWHIKEIHQSLDPKKYLVELDLPVKYLHSLNKLPNATTVKKTGAQGQALEPLKVSIVVTLDISLINNLSIATAEKISPCLDDYWKS